MKKTLAWMLTVCVVLCLLCSCDLLATDGGEDTAKDPIPETTDTAVELLSRVHRLSTTLREGETDTEEMVVDVRWSETGVVLEGTDGAQEDSFRIEVTLDDQNRPATMVRTDTEQGQEPQQQTTQFLYEQEGRVKLLIDDGADRGQRSFVYEYNETGQVTREEYPSYVRTIEYDENGNCIRTLTDHKGADQADVERVTAYTYDDSGKAVSAVQTYTSGEEVQIRYTYYPNGNLMQTTEVSSHGHVNLLFHPYNPKDLTWSSGKQASAGMDYTAEKDEQGRIVKVVETARFKDEQRTATFAYDAQGRLIETTDFSGPTSRLEYDAQGRMVKQIIENPEGGTGTHLYTYDDQGRMTRWETIDSDGTGMVQLREYNEAGMTVKETRTYTYKDGSTSTTVSEYDYVSNDKCKVNRRWVALFTQLGLIS